MIPLTRVPVIEKQVVERDIVVDELGAERRERRDNVGSEPGEDPIDELSAAGLLLEHHPARQLRQVLLVPPDRAAGGGMEEAPQRPADPGDDLAEVRDRLRVEVRGLGGPAGQQRQQAHEMRGPADLGGGDR